MIMYLNNRAVLSATALMIGSCLATGCADKGAQPPRKAESIPVVVTTVRQKTVPVDILAVGNVEAYSTIRVKAQVGGELTKVSFHEGDFVKKGDLLFTIDPRPFEAQLSQAQANLARDTAALSQAQANLARDIANEKYAQDQAGALSRIVRSGRGFARTGRPDGSSADALRKP